MAVEVIAALTLMRFYFGRSGDRWKHAEPRLRRRPIAPIVFGLLNITKVWAGPTCRVPIACPHCGVLRLTSDDTFAIRFWGGGVDDATGKHSEPERIQCLACDRRVHAVDLLSGWKAKDLDALLTTGPLRGLAPVPRTYIVDEHEPTKFWIGRTIYDALHRNVGKVFPLERRLSRIEAMDADHAARLAEEHHASMTWRDVLITPELEAVDIDWHGGPLQAWEKQKLDRRKRQAKRLARINLDAEVEAFRKQREAELLGG